MDYYPSVSFSRIESASRSSSFLRPTVLHPTDMTDGRPSIVSPQPLVPIEAVIDQEFLLGGTGT